MLSLGDPIEESGSKTIDSLGAFAILEVEMDANPGGAARTSARGGSQL